jgi:hypothetical protein
MPNRSFSTGRSMFLVLVIAGIAQVSTLSAQAAVRDSPDIFGLWLTTDPQGVSVMQIVAESADSTSVGIGHLPERFASVFRCSIEHSWSYGGDWYYSVATVTPLIDREMLEVTYYLLRVGQDGNTLEIERSSAEQIRRSSAAAPQNADRVIYHRLHLS